MQPCLILCKNLSPLAVRYNSNPSHLEYSTLGNALSLRNPGQLAGGQLASGNLAGDFFEG